MVNDLMVYGSMERWKDRGYILILLGINMRVDGEIIYFMVKGFIPIQMAISMMVNG